MASSELNERIEAALWQVQTGRKSLAEMPSSLQAWYFVAYDDGARSRDAEVMQLRNELARERLTADRLYLAAFTPADRREFLLSRLDEAFAAVNGGDTDQLFVEAIERYIASLDDVRSAA